MSAEPAISNQRPITELSNEMTEQLDGSNSPDLFLRQLQAADSQIYSGFKGFPNLFSVETIGAIESIAAQMRKVISTGGKVVMTGCGTSGRIAFLTARRYKLSSVGYCIAGGDSALVLSDELPEDDPVLGVADVEEYAKSNSSWYVVGVTCGLSAPYVAGQIARSVSEQSDRGWGSGCAVIGFNPAHLARDREIKHCLPDGASSTFRKVVEFARTTSQKFSLLNPVVGPEPVAGSSRMKGGSATLILLDCICQQATNTCSPIHPASLLVSYQSVHTLTYAAALNQVQFQQIMSCAAESLSCCGRIFYVGSGSEGCVGFIDFSEMPDTFGAPFDQTRAFVIGGWSSVGNTEGDISNRSPLLNLDADHFSKEIVPSLQHRDTVIFLATDATDDMTKLKISDLINLCNQQTARTSLVVVNSENSRKPSVPQYPSCTIEFHLDLRSHAHSGFSDYAFKILLNAVSTFAQAKGRGALYRGLMIAAGPSNDKIYQRCVEMISSQIGVSTRDAEIAVIRSIYGIDRHDDKAIETKLSLQRIDHIRAALLPEDQRHLPTIVLPVAFLLAIPPRGRFRGWSVDAARKAVSQEHQLSLLIARALASQMEAGQTQPLMIGVDLGGTSIRSVVLTPEGKVIGSIQRATLLDDRSPNSVLAQVCELIRRAIDQLSPETRLDVTCVGIGQPGCVLDDGSITAVAAFANSWGEGNIVPLSDTVTKFLREEILLPVKPYIFDDAECALAAEVFLGSGQLANTVAMITIGTGLGSAISLKRGTDFHRGARGLIELGHMIACPSKAASERTLRCACGQWGCTELFASGRAIVRLAEGKFGTAEEVLAATATDATCAAAVDSTASALAIAIINTIRAYDPDVVVVGGGLAPVLLPIARTHLRSLTWKLHNDAADVPVSLPSCQEPGAFGAGILAWRKFRDLQNVERPMSSSKFSLRHASRRDIPGLYNVCLKTGDSGKDGTHLYSDPNLLGSIFVGEYVTLSSAFAFALIDDERMDQFSGVSGYVLGVLDTTTFSEACDKHWWPALQEQYPLHKLQNFREIEQGFIKDYIHKIPSESGGPLRLSPAQLKQYPSHMHIDLLPHAQGRKLGPIMVMRLLDALRGAGSSGIHLCMSAVNHRAFNFYTKLGFHLELKGESDWIMARRL